MFSWGCFTRYNITPLPKNGPCQRCLKSDVPLKMCFFLMVCVSRVVEYCAKSPGWKHEFILKHGPDPPMVQHGKTPSHPHTPQKMKSQQNVSASSSSSLPSWPFPPTKYQPAPSLAGLQLLLPLAFRRPGGW